MTQQRIFCVIEFDSGQKGCCTGDIGVCIEKLGPVMYLLAC